MHFSKFLAGALAGAGVMAHPGHDATKEMAERRAFFQNRPRDLSHCAEKLKRSGVERRSVQRRAKRTLDLASQRAPGSLKKRQLEDFLGVDHESDEDFSMDTDPADLFAGESVCMLNPEATEGPYYVSGEFVRDDNTEDQEGVFLGIDTQVIDVDTCDPVPGVYVEIWHCNATGVYGGVVAEGNGDGESDPDNINNTWLRGVQETDADGVTAFSTIFPGHYTGRTTHVHVMVHAGAEPLSNGTLYNTAATHVGQMYFDQDLISKVEKTAPYSANEQELTTNAEDDIMKEEAATGADPIMSYVMLGDSVEDGMLAWLAFGVDMSFVRNVTAATTNYEGGGVANPDAEMGGRGGAPPGGEDGGPPSGATPSGSSTVPCGSASTGAAEETTAAYARELA